jgi:purine-binding chemotaxis protein CheW
VSRRAACAERGERLVIERAGIDRIGVDRTADELRRAFDGAFAQPPVAARERVEDFINIRVGGDAYAIRLREISEVVARRPIVPVPAAAAHLLGVAGIRGSIVPVFALAPLLGYRGEWDAPWLVLVAGSDPIALAFSEFAGYAQLPASAIHTNQTPGRRREHAREYAREIASTGEGARAIVTMPLIVAAVRNRLGHDEPPPSDEK